MKISKREFVESAYRQARESGLNDTQARLAASQAALETGYGRSVVGNNYFGIKAGSSWNGPSVSAGTWEDTANGPVRERARFRSYSNPVSAFGDWASTVGRRWSSAFNAPTFNEAVEGLNYGQPGGYATDRNYGAKLRSINARYGPQADQVDGIMSAINPAQSVTPMARPMTMAEQYGLLDQARGMQRDMGLLRQDVMEQDPMGQLRRDLLAREAAYKMATAPAPATAPIDVPEVETPSAMTAFAPTGEAMAGHLRQPAPLLAAFFLPTNKRWCGNSKPPSRKWGRTAGYNSAKSPRRGSAPLAAAFSAVCFSARSARLLAASSGPRWSTP
ncbi:glycoside hydrolase family 73 protein [Sinorhizobium meliloti]|uniref:glycoside hydrolase family 73 protein n=1 Tax=Rhizobium meliloti TaxID=382 RepID=UPI000FD9FA97|nr:glucosaminidase domain-containing protein [Sinorhizobium meliloti]RVI91829.1 hypothetical protein CN190_03545 [Sinorhizobium meliloti]